MRFTALIMRSIVFRLCRAPQAHYFQQVQYLLKLHAQPSSTNTERGLETAALFQSGY